VSTTNCRSPRPNATLTRPGLPGPITVASSLLSLIEFPLLFNIAMDDFCGIAALFEGFFHGLGEHDGAVFAAGTAEGNREITFSFADVVRDQVGQQAFDAAQEFASLGKRANVAADFGIFAGEGAKARDEMRVGEKAHVENQVSVRGD